MNASQRFAVSLHILTLLASSDAPMTSEAIAASVDTHPVVIRRTMANLREHGLVESKPGANGGWRLLRKPGKIGLREVYCMLHHEDVLAIHGHPNKKCPVGSHIKETLSDIFSSAQAEMENALDQYTVADVLKDVMARGGK